MENCCLTPLFPMISSPSSFLPCLSPLLLRTHTYGRRGKKYGERGGTAVFPLRFLVSLAHGARHWQINSSILFGRVGNNT